MCVSSRKLVFLTELICTAKAIHHPQLRTAFLEVRMLVITHKTITCEFQIVDLQNIALSYLVTAYQLSSAINSTKATTATPCVKSNLLEVTKVM